MRAFSSLTAVLLSLTIFVAAAFPVAAMSPYDSWKNGPSADPSYFPLAVWLQSPSNAAKYQAAGINLYVGLWQGPTEDQLSKLKSVGMRVICNQNAVGLAHLSDTIIAGWMHGDEPDNAQSLGEGKGYGPPVLPDSIIADYRMIRAADSTRPVLLNLGQGVAWDGWYGRGTRTNHPEDYPEYAKGGDLVSFDIYPVATSDATVRGNLWYVPYGVGRLVTWAGPSRAVWNCIECTGIQSGNKPTPAQVRSEVWMSIIHGSKGIIYFVHEWIPKFNERALLDDPAMLAAVTALNARIRELAPVLNSPTVESAATVRSSNTAVPVDVMMKSFEGCGYIFAAAMREGTTRASFSVVGVSGGATVEVIGENRSIAVADETFEDDFDSYGVHLYRIRSATGVSETVGPSVFALSSRPNPFNPSTTITFSLPRSGTANLAVYTVSGQMVRLLRSGQMIAGTHTATWDGRDDSGRPVSSGVYISRLTSGNAVTAGKMLLLR